MCRLTDHYLEFAALDPAGRTTRVLRLLEDHPKGRLEMPVRDGQHVTLDEINLSPQYLRAQFSEDLHPPVWWHKERQAIDLRHADLRGASVRHADLHSAVLEESNLAGADLAGIRPQGADLSGAHLERTLFEDADLGKAVLRFCHGRDSVWESAKLHGADFWGADMERADLSGADLQGANLEEASFRGASLAGADLRGAILRRANFTGANLAGADLRGAVLGGTNLDGALLGQAQLQELDLTTCSLNHIHTCNTRLERTYLDRGQIAGVIGEELQRDFGSARRGYLALERNFNELGDHDGARWAYRRRRRMEKRQARQNAGAAWATGQLGRAQQ